MVEIGFINVLLIGKSAICLLIPFSLLIGFMWAAALALRDGITHLKRLHAIPCDCCIYSTGCYLLKCTVHPSKAFTEESLNCLDFEPALDNPRRYSNRCKP
jgi:hypothetical protein